MYYLKSRYYDPVVCRFINADDPANLGADNTILSYNLFAYCNNNPVAGYDPTGMFDWEKAGLIALSAVEAIAGTILIASGCSSVGTPLLSAGISSLLGGYFNERSGGSFSAGWCGGEIFGILNGIGLYWGGKCLAVNYYDSAIFFSMSGGFAGGYLNDLVIQKIDKGTTDYIHAAKVGSISSLVSLLTLPFSVVSGVIQPFIPGLAGAAAVVTEVFFDGLNGEVGQIINMIN